MTSFNRLKELADDVLCERQGVRTPAEARLALELHSMEPEWFACKENCSCGKENECDECWTRDEVLLYLTTLAGTVRVTGTGNIDINCGGHVIAKPLREWHRLARTGEP